MTMGEDVEPPTAKAEAAAKLSPVAKALAKAKAEAKAKAAAPKPLPGSEGTILTTTIITLLATLRQSRSTTIDAACYCDRH